MIFSGCWSDKESSCAYELVGLATNVYILSWTNPAWCFSNVFISPHVAWSESIKPGNWQATIPRSMHRFYFGTWFPKCVPCTRAARARFFWNNSQEAYSWLFWRWPTWLVEIIKRSRLKIPEWVFEHQSDWHRTPPVVFFLSRRGAGEVTYLWVSLYCNFMMELPKVFGSLGKAPTWNAVCITTLELACAVDGYLIWIAESASQKAPTFDARVEICQRHQCLD